MILMYSVGSHLLNKLELENNQSSCNREKLGLNPPCCKKNKNYASSNFHTHIDIYKERGGRIACKVYVFVGLILYQIYL